MLNYIYKHENKTLIEGLDNRTRRNTYIELLVVSSAESDYLLGKILFLFKGTEGCVLK